MTPTQWLNHAKGTMLSLFDDPKPYVTNIRFPFNDEGREKMLQEAQLATNSANDETAIFLTYLGQEFDYKANMIASVNWNFAAYVFTSQYAGNHTIYDKIDKVTWIIYKNMGRYGFKIKSNLIAPIADEETGLEMAELLFYNNDLYQE